jgi:hypothetical protein
MERERITLGNARDNLCIPDSWLCSEQRGKKQTNILWEFIFVTCLYQ